jgi:hypothetical protein
MRWKVGVEWFVCEATLGLYKDEVGATAFIVDDEDDYDQRKVLSPKMMPKFIHWLAMASALS